MIKENKAESVLWAETRMMKTSVTVKNIHKWFPQPTVPTPPVEDRSRTTPSSLTDGEGEEQHGHCVACCLRMSCSWTCRDVLLRI